MKRNLLTLALSLLFTAGAFAQVLLGADVHKQKVQEDLSSYQLTLDKEKEILYDIFNEVIPENSISTFDNLGLSQQESSTSAQSSQSGVSWKEDFENGNLGNFKVINGGDPYSFSYHPSGGREREGCVRIRYHATLAHDDYLVTPAMKPTAKSFLTFWGKNRNARFKEKFDVLLSTTGTKKTDFTVKLARDVTPNHAAYQKFEYNLGKYAGQTVYVALHIKTTNVLLLNLDDFSFETISSHDLRVTKILPDVVLKGGSKIPTVTVYNQGENEESAWSITLTDGKGYTHENKTPGKIGSRKSITLSFPKWSPTDPNSELTATVTLANDTDKSNNVLKHKVPVITPTYAKETLYACNSQDRTAPINMTGDFLKIDKYTAKLTTIKKSKLTGIYAGDFVGTGDKKVLYGINSTSKKVYVVNGNGDKYYHMQITNLKEDIQGFTWDSQTNTMFVTTYANPNDKLYKLDENFKATFVGNLFTTRKIVRSIACDVKGKMYALTNDATLYSINQQNAKVKQIGKLGINIRYGQEMAFDRGSGLLYGSLFKSVGFTGATGGLYMINTTTGKAKQVGKDYSDHVVILGTFGDPLPDKDLSAVAITPELVPSGSAVHPQVSIRNDGLEAQTNWSVRLTDGTGYNKTVKNTGGSLKPFESTIVTFDEWKPADGKSTLTATVILAGDAKPAKNTVRRVLDVKKLSYVRNDIYAYIAADITDPRNTSKHIVKINNKSAAVKSLKLSTMESVFTGDFIGDFNNAKLLGISLDDSRVHLIDGSGNTYKYATITGVPASITCFTWDKKNDKMYVVVRHDNKTKLYSLDKGFRGKYIGVVSESVQFYGIAADSNGNLFGLGGDNKLHKINTTTAKLTTVGDLGFRLRFAQEIGFDKDHDILYGTLVKRVGNAGVGGLYTINVNTGKATLVGKAYTDQAIMLGTFGREPAPKDLKVTAIAPSKIIIGGSNLTPKVTIKNSGTESQAVWSVRLTDGKGYDQTVNNPGALAKGALKVVSFPKWVPADGKYTLTATVVLAGDNYTDNNVMTEKAEVITPKYTRSTIYAYNTSDWSAPRNMTNHIMNVDRNTAKISSIKASKLSDVRAGDFVGDFDNAKLFGVAHSDSKVHLINGNGDTYHYKTITGVSGKINGFTWDKSSNKIYVSTTGANSKLYVLDAEFSGTLVGQISEAEILGIAADSKGNMFGIGKDDKFYSINKTTGKGIVVGPLGIKINFAQDIGFDRMDDTLFGTLYKGSGTGGLYTINVKTGKATKIKNDFKDRLAMLGTYGRIPAPKDLRVSEISPSSLLLSGSKATPKVTVKNAGTESQATWSVKLTDGKGYDKTVNNTGALAKGASKVVTFPEWAPADGKYTLTATVTLTGDKYLDNNVMTEKIDVIKPKYTRSTIYAYNTSDWTTPDTEEDHIMNVNRNTAKISSIKATKLSDVRAGDFVGDFDNAKLLGVDYDDSRVHLINGNGDTYYYKTITGVSGKINGFTWDKSSNKIYVSTTGANSKLYVLDSEFSGTLVGQISEAEILGIAADSKGNMFGIGKDDKFYSINKTNGKGNVVGPLGIKIDYSQDIGFDRTDDTLFGTLYKGLGTGGLYTINVKTGKATQIEKDFKDRLAMLGTYGRIPAPKDLKVSAISPFGVLLSGEKATPTVTVKNTGTESQAVWSVKLTDGKGYDKTVNNTGALAKGASKVVTFPEWAPADGKYTLTATVTLTGDKYLDNNVMAEKVAVVKTKYERSIIYAYNASDRSNPRNMTNHVMKVDRSTAKISSIKATKLKNVYAGGFVGPYDKAKLFAITSDDSKVHLVNGDGETYYYKTITGVSGDIFGFTWDQSSNKIYVSNSERTPKLYVLDADFKATLVGSITNNYMLGIASDSKGNLFGLGVDDKLYKINKTNGKGKVVGPLGFGINYAQDIGFDRMDDTLFGTLYKGNGTGGLYTINVNTGKATQIKKDFQDELIMLGTYGRIPAAKDLKVSAITPSGVLISGEKATPTVTVKNTGSESQAVWSVKLTDGKGYDKTVNNPGALAKGASKVVTFPEWSPVADGKYTLTATVTLTGDKYLDNNVLTEKVTVVKPKYEREIIYAYNAADLTVPRNMKGHIMKVNRSTAKMSSIKATKLTNVFTGGFVGSFEITKLLAVTYDDNKVHLVNGNGDTYYYKSITGVSGKVAGFTWDQYSNKIYVSNSEKPAKLYVLDDDFKGTLVGSIANTNMLGIASDSKGNLFGLGIDSKLYKINKTNGKGKLIGELGITINFAQDIGFDRMNDTLYGTLMKRVGRSGTGGLYTINVSTGKATQIKSDFKDELIMLGTYGKPDVTATDFHAFSFAEQAKPATIDKAKHTISISIKAGTDVTKLKATFTLSEGATAKVGTVAQVSGTTVNDFTNPVTYNVTAKNGKASQKWIVTVTVEKPKSDKTDFTAFSFAEQAKPATIDKAKHTINISVKAGTDVTKLKATFALSEGATAKVGTVAQVSSTTVNDFTKPVTYEVTAEDGTTKQKWVVTVKSSSTPTSIDKSLAENGIAIYPNPSNGIFNVEVNEPFTMEIIDINGRVVVERETLDGVKRVELPNSGVYFIKFINEKTSLTQRIIVSQ